MGWVPCISHAHVKCYHEGMKLLFPKSFNENSVTPPLFALMEQGDVEGVRTFFSRKTPTNIELANRSLLGACMLIGTVDQKTSAGVSVSKLAAEYVKIMIDFGADVNYRRRMSDALPLAVAASYGHLDAAKLLVEGGAVIYSSKSSAPNAVELAVRNDHREIVEYFLSQDIQVNAGYVPLWFDAIEYSTQYLDLFFAHGADINALTTGNGDGALHYWVEKCCNGNGEPLGQLGVAVSYLLDKGLDFDFKNDRGMTAEQLAVQMESPEIAQRIREVYAEHQAGILQQSTAAPPLKSHVGLRI